MTTTVTQALRKPDAQAVVSEFAPSTASPLGLPWEQHDRCRRSLQQDYLHTFYHHAATIAGETAPAATQGQDQGVCSACLSLMAGVLTWDFRCCPCSSFHHVWPLLCTRLCTILALHLTMYAPCWSCQLTAVLPACCHTWAARYNTRLLMKLTLEGVVSSVYSVMLSSWAPVKDATHYQQQGTMLPIAALTCDIGITLPTLCPSCSITVHV